ncbi:ABC transporter [Arthrobacter sp. MYb211]|uniref:ABC transporter permease n=1 Tax=unclassified Arthrobacter TaxID=235627 RepID=UPI000CFBE3F1|nr:MULTISPECIES: ABC transporter permease [unclassified Arthrobacter]PRA06484.1 ABC transporter [Arthrobacter sp. MYb229]PRA12584.1 ABC transporter [Arthrobacter sp. MYb221]PRB53386.1 ABC transporter [Arthrobacter sp. MYb216]PRC09897.1 ABC transporter [Arthrobacter sp. MYb211]
MSQTIAKSNAVSTPKRIALQGKYETIMMLSNGEQLVLAVVLPIIALFGLTFTDLLEGVAPRSIDAAVPGVLALCVISTAFTGQGIGTGFDRRYGVLRMFSTTPLGKTGLIFGKVIAVLTVLAIQVVLITLVALLLGWEPNLFGILPAILFLLLGAAAFTALGLLIAGTVRPEATLAITNLAWILLAGVGGVLFPLSMAPHWIQPTLDALPSAALGDAMRSALIEGRFSIASVIFLVLWAAAGSFAAIKLFKWN